MLYLSYYNVPGLYLFPIQAVYFKNSAATENMLKIWKKI